MMGWDVPPRGSPTDAWRRALAETRAVAERALMERDRALAEVERLQAELSRERAEPEPVVDPRVAELAADLANVRRQRDEAIARARAEERGAGLLALAEVHDDLQRSVVANPDPTSPWYVGHRAILASVRARLQRLGASELGAVGQPFDPTVHEAVGTAPGPAGVVTAVEASGWRLADGTLVRPARVRVGA